MKRRSFLGLLSLPIIMPVARKIHAFAGRLRKPSGNLLLYVENPAPLVVRIEGDEIVERFLFPGPRRTINIPISMSMSCPIKVTFDSKRPIRFYAPRWENRS